ncbi:hypothetical protein TPAU25S_02844 [Tsukamurella paurometabola]|uniref:DUF6194 domain-containing protein n=1 Tax=Tsukamurella paurometabola (strain ATCC 8368 / DSM 20162 / CCUG 35730 / CIP 100753 / JCM 10117 / KCTC 9821 / NBRC 16120 / NCIMB 702349 / NCTC 13040) TaxID=521096 RepID=D5UWS6_TSUPD|nr:DUF6194 family protein [Tsukamurella paurometabola]ADG77948.1 conserved hypothetical protein [Tsukamurella paurometabola DSM 20162]SUP29481.1 Uncharacterised protein [Tsukamurella paurometabola]
MSMQQIIAFIRSLDDVVELAPESGSEFPEIAWGDHFFYFSPGGTIPQRGQPFATIVTKDYPDDDRCDLDPPGRFRVNAHVGRSRLDELVTGDPADDAAADQVIPHPLYSRQGWVAVVTPGPGSTDLVTGLLREAHAAAVARADRH